MLKEKDSDLAPCISSAYPVSVNYGALAPGLWEYTLVTELITSKSALSGKTGEELKIFHVLSFGRALSTKEVLNYITENNLRAANTEELVAFGIAYEEQLPVIALGTLYDHGEVMGVPWAIKNKNKKMIGVDWIIDNWSSITKFLVVED